MPISIPTRSVFVADVVAADAAATALRPAGMLARSPVEPAAPTTIIDGWEVSARRSAAALTIADLTGLTVMQVTPVGSEQRDVPHGFAKHTEHGTMMVGSGPGEWLVVGRQASVAAHLSAWADEQPGGCRVVDLTHGRAIFRLAGDAMFDVIAKVCAVDLSDDVRPNGSALRTSVASLAVDLVRDDMPDGAPAMLLHCERSSGRYLFETLLDAGIEFGIDVDGFHGPLTSID